MKKILFIISIFAFTQFSTAQKKGSTKTTATTSSNSSSSNSSSRSGGEGFDQGDWVISGQFGYGSKKNLAGGSDSTLAILPSVGYFLKENLALVGTLGIKNTSTAGVSGTTLVVGAAVRYYMTPASKFSLFGQGGIGFESSDGLTVIELGVRPGLNYFVAKNFSLEATFGNIGIVNTSPKGGNGSTDFNFGINMSNITSDFGLGLNYRF